MKNKKETVRLKRHRRIRLKIRSDTLRPRLVVRRTLRNIFAQIIDDTKNKVMLNFSTQDKDIKGMFPHAGNVKSAGAFGEAFAQRAKEKGVTKIIFDRAGFLYHGRIKAFAQGLRKGGLEF